MSNLVRLASARKTTRAALFGTWYNGGSLLLYDGTVPAGPDTAITDQVLLATFTLPSANGDATAGVWTLANGTAAALIAANGTPDFARGKDSSGVVVADYDVGVTGSGAAVEVDNLNLVQGALVSLLSFTTTEG